MSIGEAFWGGFGSFFSVWVFCLLQVTPFLLAFVVAASLTQFNGEEKRSWGRELLSFGVWPLVGFILLFAGIGMVNTSLSKAIFKYMNLLNQVGGVVIALAGLYFVGWLSVKLASERNTRIAVALLGFTVGAALAVAYKPCVTPTLTKIFNINTSPDTGMMGGVYLVSYAMGISTVILFAGAALVWILALRASTTVIGWVKKGCGAALLVIALLILSDKMTAYKSFLVEGFVPTDGGGHEHKHEVHDHSVMDHSAMEHHHDAAEEGGESGGK